MPQKVNKKYRELRATLIGRGKSLRLWAVENGYPISTVYDAARGTRAGVESVRIRRKLEEFVYGR